MYNKGSPSLLQNSSGHVRPVSNLQIRLKLLASTRSCRPECALPGTTVWEVPQKVILFTGNCQHRHIYKEYRIKPIRDAVTTITG